MDSFQFFSYFGQLIYDFFKCHEERILYVNFYAHASSVFPECYEVLRLYFLSDNVLQSIVSRKE